MLSCQVVKELHMVRGRLGALLLITQSATHSAAVVLGVGIQSGKRGNQFCLTMNSLRWPRNDAAVSAEGAPSSCFRKLVATAQNPRFDAKPGSAVEVRRRRKRNCYFHSSTVRRMRRETLRVFFQLAHPPFPVSPGAVHVEHQRHTGVQ